MSKTMYQEVSNYGLLECFDRCNKFQRNFQFEQMTSITEVIRHYQRSIDRSVKDEARLLHCLDKLNKLPINMKYLQDTRVGRTVNNLRKHDGVVGHKATALVAKWKREVVVENADASDKDERLYSDDTENVEPHTRKNYTENQENGEHSTSNSDLLDQTDNKSLSASSSTDSNTSKSSCSRRKSSKNFDREMLESHQSNSSILKSSAKRKSNNFVSSECHRKKTKNSKREDRGNMNDKKRRRESDIVDIDCTMGTSFAVALGMVDVLTTSKAKKLPNDESSLSSKTSTSGKHKKIGIRSPFDETPILLTKRPQRVELPLDIAVETLSTVTQPIKRQRSFRQPKKQTNQLTDEVATNIISRTTKTIVFSGNNAGLKCKNVPTLFEMCIKILQDNIDLLEFIGGVPFDILRPVLERTTCEQLMALEDYNPYLMEDTHCLWEQHCKRRFRTKSREELETWRDMYIRCLDEEQAKFNTLTAIIKVSKERQTKPAYVDTHTIATKSTKTNHMMSTGEIRSSGGESGSQSATKSKDSNQIRKRLKKSNDDPDWTPTTWYKTLYKKVREPKPPPPKQQIKKNIDILRYDRAKALERKKEECKKRHR